MTAGERFTWCTYCGGLFPFGMAHACAGPGNLPRYVPNPPYQHPGGTYVAPALTEADVRRIVREELERALSSRLPPP